MSPRKKETTWFDARRSSVFRFIPLFLFLLLYPYLIVAQTPKRWHTPPERWTEPRIYHTPFEKEFENRIRISRVSMAEVKGEKKFSPNRAYWFLEKNPDFSKPGPWTTTLFIFNERDYLIQIQLMDHASYEVKTQWVNEKLLPIQVWWGRVLGSHLIYDVEKERILAQEMVHDGQIPFDQFQEGLKKTSPGKPSR